MKSTKKINSVNLPLRRNYDGAIAGGVLNGLALKLGMNVSLLRLIFILSVLFSGGLFIALYVLMYLIIPSEKSKLESNVSGSRMLKLALGIVISIFVIVFLLDAL